MSLQQYGDIISEIVQPTVINNVVNTSMEDLYRLGTRNTNVFSGANITPKNKVTQTYNGGAFTRADANPDSMTQAFVTPYWTKKYYAEKATIRREDLDEALAGTPMTNLLMDAATEAAKGCMTHVFTGSMTQIKADIDDTDTYSDAAITRATIGASYEEDTDGTITLAYLRGCTAATALKDTINWNDYFWLLEQTVRNSSDALMNATGSWNVSTPTGQTTGGLATGYAPVRAFDNVAIETTYGMTTGDCYLINRNDLQIQEHKPLEIEIVKSDEQYAYDITARIGVNVWVQRPKFQAKMTDKD